MEQFRALLSELSDVNQDLGVARAKLQETEIKLEVANDRVRRLEDEVNSLSQENIDLLLGPVVELEPLDTSVELKDCCSGCNAGGCCGDIQLTKAREFADDKI